MSAPHILEAYSQQCAVVFNPHDEADLIHYSCGWLGELVGAYSAAGPTPARTYVVGLPVMITVSDAGIVTYGVDMAEAASAIRENAFSDDDAATDDEREADAARVAAHVESGR